MPRRSAIRRTDKPALASRVAERRDVPGDRDERAAASSPRAAIRAAFDRVWITIVDTHVASLLAAGVLFQFGTGAVRGFALTLALGLLANVFTAVFVSRTLFDVALRRRTA